MPVKRLLFWSAVFLLCAAITHLGYVLYAPHYQMAKLMRAAIAAAPVNTLALLDAAQQARLFPDDSPGELRAICPFDLAAGDLMLAGAMPDAPWIVAVYSPRGELVYALSRAQAGVDEIVIAIKPGKGLGALVTPRESEAIINDGWTLESASATGLAVIWAAPLNPLERGRQAARLKQSSCRIKPAA
jgi:uncharacterized membrane protein